MLGVDACRHLYGRLPLRERLGRKVTLTFVLLVGLLTSMSVSQGSIIIQDSFSRNGPLLGSITDIGQAWTGNGAFITDGSALVVSSNHAPRIAGLTFLPHSAYELSLDLSVTAGGSGWIAFGYSNTGPNNQLSSSRGAMLHRETPQIQTFAFGNFVEDTINVASGFPKTLSILLETGSTLANSTLEFKVDGAPVGSILSTDASTINGVFIQAHQGRGTVDNFVLSRIVPEPTSFAVFALLTFGIVSVRCRRECCGT